MDSRMETIADWKEPYREGVIYYKHEGRVRGVLLWNVWGKVDVAREVIASRALAQEKDLRATFLD
jgi:3-phenylpropionate/trans-cinnamate dioxygenase ferredoxin reductase component